MESQRLPAGSANEEASSLKFERAREDARPDGLAVARKYRPFRDDLSKLIGRTMPFHDAAVDPKALCSTIADGMSREVSPGFARPVSIRYGWAHVPEEGDIAHTLIHSADQRMYRQHARSDRYDVELPADNSEGDQQT